MYVCILKTSSVTPDCFYVFYLLLSFSTVKVLKKSVRGKFLGANVLKITPLGDDVGLSFFFNITES